MTQSNIRTTLLQIGAIGEHRITRFADGTRDRDVPVWHDPSTGVIFIDDFYVGDHEYVEGHYRRPEDLDSFEDLSDTRRRIQAFEPVVFGRSIIDFGCGAGSFLRAARPFASKVQGVELDGTLRERLR